MTTIFFTPTVDFFYYFFEKKHFFSMFTLFFLKHNTPTIFENSFYTHFVFVKNTPYFPTNLLFFLLSGMGSPGAGRNPQNFKNLGVTPNKIEKI